MLNIPSYTLTREYLETFDFDVFGTNIVGSVGCLSASIENGRLMWVALHKSMRCIIVLLAECVGMMTLAKCYLLLFWVTLSHHMMILSIQSGNILSLSAAPTPLPLPARATSCSVFYFWSMEEQLDNPILTNTDLSVLPYNFLIRDPTCIPTYHVGEPYASLLNEWQIVQMNEKIILRANFYKIQYCTF